MVGRVELGPFDSATPTQGPTPGPVLGMGDAMLFYGDGWGHFKTSAARYIDGRPAILCESVEYDRRGQTWVITVERWLMERTSGRIVLG